MRPVLPKGVMLHTECRKMLDEIKQPFCMKCGVPLAAEEEEYCEECMRKADRGWEAGRSIFPYHGSVENALRLVKKEGTREFVSFFAKQMYINQKNFIRWAAPDCIVPVPLHRSRLRSRGFNQAELLAYELGKEVGLPVRLLLKKVHKTKDQKNLNRAQRQTNVTDAFLTDEDAIGEQLPASVLLLDDVCTTRSTLTACAQTLKARGVERVTFLTVCAAMQSE